MIAAFLVLLLLVIEAGISMAEVSFFSVSPLALQRLKHKQEKRRDSIAGASKRRVRLVEQTLREPSSLLGTVLVLDTLVSIALSSVMTVLAVLAARRLRYPETVSVLLGDVILVLVLLILGESVPKLFALRHPLRYALGLAPYAAIARKVLAPVVHLLDGLNRRVLSSVKPVPFPTETELKYMIEQGKERGVIVGNEEEILWNLVELNRRTVSEIMTPRIDMQAVERGATVRTVMELVRRTHRSRIPVYDQTIDRVVGVFYAKDIFHLPDDSVPVGTVCREVYIVPEVKRVMTLLEDFRRRGVHLAVTVDEFGQTAGVVTLEDVLEVIFGEIRDEYDSAEILPYFRLDARTYSVDGDIDLATLNRLFRHAFRGQPHERLSGLIHDVLGRLPKSGDEFDFADLHFEVQQVTENKIDRVRISRCKTPAPGTDDGGAESERRA